MTIIEKWPRAKALKLRAILERIKMCGCGTDAHWECVLELLGEAEKHSDRGFYRDKWYEFGAKVLDGWELVEHGTGIGWAWLTDDGKLVLEFLQDFGTEDHSWDEGTGHPAWSIEYSWSAVKASQVIDSYEEWAMGITHREER